MLPEHFKELFSPKDLSRMKKSSSWGKHYPEWVWEGWAEAAGSGASDRGIRRVSAGGRNTTMSIINETCFFIVM